MDNSLGPAKGLNGTGAAGAPTTRRVGIELPGKSLFRPNNTPRSYPKIRLYRQGELSPIVVIVSSAVVSFVILLLAFLWVFMNNPNAGLLVVVALFGPFIFARLAATWYDQMLKSRLRNQGRSVEAHIVDLWTEHEASESGSEATEVTFYMAAYQFNVGLGSQTRTLTLQEVVKEEHYNQLKQGQVVRLFYMEDQPEVALVEFLSMESSAGRSL